jgi:hypothetical protein
MVRPEFDIKTGNRGISPVLQRQEEMMINFREKLNYPPVIEEQLTSLGPGSPLKGEYLKLEKMHGSDKRIKSQIILL